MLRNTKSGEIGLTAICRESPEIGISTSIGGGYARTRAIGAGWAASRVRVAVGAGVIE